jgi:hypothetical protein
MSGNHPPFSADAGVTRRSFAHEAVLVMRADADSRAPGAAVTVALCGHWEHPPPCPLAAHHTRVDRVGEEVRVRILFATAAGAEDLVRRHIDRALSAGRFEGPDAVVTGWEFRTSGRSEVTEDEAAHAERLTR